MRAVDRSYKQYNKMTGKQMNRACDVIYYYHVRRSMTLKGDYRLKHIALAVETVDDMIENGELKNYGTKKIPTWRESLWENFRILCTSILRIWSSSGKSI